MDNNKDKFKRIEWIDIAKGICIISVILGHLGQFNINRIVFTYHLPVFFLVSGYLLNKRSDLVFIKHNFQKLIKPYISTCIIIVIIATLLSFLEKGDCFAVFMSWIKASLYGAGDNYDKPFEIKKIGAIWFLLALFFARVIVNHFIDKKYGNIVILAISYFGWASYNMTGLWLPLSVQAGMLASSYVMIGYKIKESDIDLTKLSPMFIIISMFIFIWGIIYFKGIWLVHNYLGNGLADYIVTICASVLVIYISVFIQNNSVVLIKILSYFGKNSLIILCFHLIELNFFRFYDFSNHVGQYFGFSDLEKLLFLIVIKLFYIYISSITLNKFHLLKKVFL